MLSSLSFTCNLNDAFMVNKPPSFHAVSQTSGIMIDFEVFAEESFVSNESMPAGLLVLLDSNMPRTLCSTASA